jgi:hypothetical protein
MVSEGVIAEQWLVGVLLGDAEVAALVGERVYSELAPQGAVMPYVTIQNQASVDVLGVGSRRIMSELVYVVRAVGRGASYVGLAPIADAIDRVLHLSRGETEEGWVLGCRREQPFRRPEVTSGVQYRHLGGLYRLWVQEKDEE